MAHLGDGVNAMAMYNLGKVEFYVGLKVSLSNDSHTDYRPDRPHRRRSCQAESRPRACPRPGGQSPGPRALPPLSGAVCPRPCPNPVPIRPAALSAGLSIAHVM